MSLGKAMIHARKQKAIAKAVVMAAADHGAATHVHAHILQMPVLVLNASYEPINICGARRALVLVLKGIARTEEEHGLSLHAQRGSLAVLDAAAFDEPSTKAAAALLAAWTEPRPTLVVVTAEESGAGLSFRNIKRVSVLVPENVGVTDLVGAASLLCSASALEQLTARAVGSRTVTEGDE